MLTTPFLTDLDSRAAVKGSRDPLGIQQIWTRMGRHVVGNLTTVSNSVRDFTTLLLGYYFAERIADEQGPGTELATFLKWEQLAAYARAAVNSDYAFRGTDRVRKNLSEGARVTLSAERDHQILGNQKIYGLWGLYTVPARSSGLVDGDPPRLTPPALELVERLYLPILEKRSRTDQRRVFDVLAARATKLNVSGADRAVVEAVGRVLVRRLSEAESKFYRSHLLYGGPQDSTSGRQRQLAELMNETLDQTAFTWSPATVGGLAKSARGNHWDTLAHHLDRIRTCETVMAPTSALFTHLLGLDGKSVNVVTERLRAEWGEGLRSVSPEAFGELRGEMAAGDMQAGERWLGIARALSAGDYGTLLDLLLEENKSVMAGRGGPPWIERRGGELHVRFGDEHGALPRREEIPTLWRFPYFLDSLRSVAATLGEERRG